MKNDPFYKTLLIDTVYFYRVCITKSYIGSNEWVSIGIICNDYNDCNIRKSKSTYQIETDLPVNRDEPKCLIIYISLCFCMSDF